MTTDWSKKACYVCHNEITLVRSLRGEGRVLIRHKEPNGMQCPAGGTVLWYVPVIKEAELTIVESIQKSLL